MGVKPDTKRPDDEKNRGAHHPEDEQSVCGPIPCCCLFKELAPDPVLYIFVRMHGDLLVRRMFLKGSYQ